MPPPPRSRSGAATPTGTEPSHSWSDLQLPVVEPALLPSHQADDLIHPAIGSVLIRQRGSYWWEQSQAKLEHEFSTGLRRPETGGFYVFLEEEQPGNVMVRYGNVLMDTYWVMKTVALPKGHPDADVPPYQMIDVTRQ